MAGTGFEPEGAEAHEPPVTPSAPPAPVPAPDSGASPTAPGDSGPVPSMPPDPPAPAGPLPPQTPATAPETPPGDHQRGAGAPRAGTALRFDGTFLLTSGPDGPTAVPGLTLQLDDAGVALSKSDGAPVWACGWDEISELAAPERSKLPDGGHGVLVVITATDGRSHRFVVPATRPATVEAAVDSLARRRKVWPERPQRSQPAVVVAAVLVVLAGALAVLLLQAGHVIQL